MHVEPHHVLLRHRGIDGFAEGNGIDLACPDPEAGSDAAHGQGAKRQTDELESGKADAMEQSVFCFLWWIRSEWVLSECIECLADNVGHERGDAASDERRQDRGEDDA